MSRRRKLADSTPFDTLRLEGSLFVPELLERAARGETSEQKEADYAVPKGLKLHDEYGRAYRIAIALWQDFAPQFPRTDVDPVGITRAFVLDLLRQCLGYTDLALHDTLVQIGDRGFPISAKAGGGRVPVIIAPHSLGLDDPDPRFAIHGAGARRKSAHQLAQEFLNASRDTLWAIVTNGRTVRLLRDAETLTRPNFLEFDLETILREGEARYADFSALWRILHATRAGAPGTPSSDCIWENWKSEGHAQGLRVRDGLRDGVTQALLILGSGFLTHRDNDALRKQLQEGTLSKEGYFHQLLRLIYRHLFLFCAEERELLHAPDSPPEARQAYAEGYSLRRLRRRSLRQTAHDSYGDLWLGLRIVFRSLASGRPALGLPALGGLFAESQCPDLDRCSLANRDLLAAMRNLRWAAVGGNLTAIDYRNMGPEELGSVYESLLELVPQVNLAARKFGFAGITDKGSNSGNVRKTTGSYYTPDCLVQELIKSALDPVIDARIKAQPERPVETLLSITVCDPACGSGHFLLAAARRLAERLAELRAPDGAVRPNDYRHALREVVNHCVYGVDLNPMAVELCKVALWLESVEPGKPLGFLDHHIQCGNSLLGATPCVLANGLPDEAFKPLTGDDKTFCSNAKKQNKLERKIAGHGELFGRDNRPGPLHELPGAMREVDAMSDDTAAALHHKEQRYADLVRSASYQNARFLADVWCAAFVWKKCPPADGGFDYAITNDVLRKIEHNPHDCPPWMREEIERLRDRYQFFHWHLAFPEVFPVPEKGARPGNERTGWNGGFDVILGNPPWDMVELSEKEYFAERAPDIATATSARKRQALIERLQLEQPQLFRAFSDSKRVIQGLRHFIQNSGMLPLGSTGRINLYPLFTEAAVNLMSEKGRLGIIVPSAIAMDAYNAPLFRSLLDRDLLVSLYDFENSRTLFPNVHRSYRFCLLTLGSSAGTIQLCYFAHDVAELNSPERRIELSADSLATFSPNTFAPPILQRTQDKEIALRTYSRFGVFLNRQKGCISPWQPSIQRMLSLSDEGDFFRRADELSETELSNFAKWSRLYSGKVIQSFNHRFATFVGEWRDSDASELRDATFVVRTEYYARAEEVEKRTQDKFPSGWLLGFRDISRATDERTAIAAIVPGVGCDTHCRNIYFANRQPALVAVLVGNLNSFVFDFFARQKVIGTGIGATILEQLPVLPPATYAEPCAWADGAGETLRDWLLPRVLELTYTAWDLKPFARDCGWFGPPFVWDEGRRFQLRCELDAAFFHLYGLSRDDTAYILDTFPIVRRKDVSSNEVKDATGNVIQEGTYRTKDTILALYDMFAECSLGNRAFKNSALPVPPADPLATHDPRVPATLRPALKSPDYFQYILPLIARLQPQGVNARRLLHALEILSETEPRHAALNEHASGAWKEWAASFPKNYAFSDAAAALQVLLGDGTLTRWKGLIRPAQDTAFLEDEWLNTDAFIALRLALAASVETVQRNQAETLKAFPSLIQLLTAA